METVQRKLIDLRAPVVRAISAKAKAKSMSFKKYVENLIEQDAATGNVLGTPGPEIITPAEFIARYL